MKAVLREELTCRKCGGTWKHTTGKIATSCPHCGAFKDARKRKYQANNKKALARKKRLIEWSANAENRKSRAAIHRALLRKRVFFRVCGSIHPKCVRCGCDDPRLLEINHKDGGGNKEMQNGKLSSRFYYSVANGLRDTKDLELLCKPCNAIHCLEMKHGPLPMRVVWSSTKLPKSQ